MAGNAELLSFVTSDQETLHGALFRADASPKPDLALVLIHGVNRFQSGGDTLFDALVNSAITRFRPILITTATTFAGLTPLMLNDGTQAQLLVPMAVSLAFGILISAPAALLLVPAFWLVLNDIGSGARRVSSLVGGVIGGAPRLGQA